MNHDSNYPQDYEEPRRGINSFALGALAAIAVVAVIAVGAWLILEHRSSNTTEQTSTTQLQTQARSEAMMPYVVNSQSEVARALLEQDGFIVTGYNFYRTYDKDRWGLVKEQPLEAGKNYPIGTEVELVVWGEESSESVLATSKTLAPAIEATVTIPNLIGQYYDDIDFSNYPELKITKETEHSNRPAGMIVNQSIDAGTKVPEATHLTLHISSGPDKVTVPDVIGQDSDDATVRVEALKLNVKIVEEMNDGSHEPGTVKSMAPAAGTSVEKGKTVTIWVWR